MKEQKLVYLIRRQSEINQIKISLEEESFELAQTLGHRLKGHGEIFGFPHISCFGDPLEKAAKARDVEKLKEVVNSLDKNVEEYIRLLTTF